MLPQRQQELSLISPLGRKQCDLHLGEVNQYVIVYPGGNPFRLCLSCKRALEDIISRVKTSPREDILSELHGYGITGEEAERFIQEALDHG